MRQRQAPSASLGSNEPDGSTSRATVSPEYDIMCDGVSCETDESVYLSSDCRVNDVSCASTAPNPGTSAPSTSNEPDGSMSREIVSPEIESTSDHIVAQVNISSSSSTDVRVDSASCASVAANAHVNCIELDSNSNQILNKLTENADNNGNNNDISASSEDTGSNKLRNLSLALRTWQLDFALSNDGLSALLDIIHTTEDVTVFKELPKNSSGLVRSVNKHYRTAPDLCVQCSECKTLIRMDGKLMVRVIGNGWFSLSRSEIYNLIKSKSFLSKASTITDTIVCSYCDAPVTLNMIKASKVFWFYSPIKWFIDDLFKSPLSVASLLKPFYEVLDKELQSLLDDIYSNRYQTRKDYVNKNSTGAKQIEDMLVKISNDSNLCSEIWEKAKSYNRNLENKSQMWHGLRFFGNNDINYRTTLWRLVLGFLFDYYGPNKYGHKSLGPLFSKCCSLPREDIASHPGRYMFNHGYLPCDREASSHKMQRYLAVYKNDFLQIRNGFYVYNCLTDNYCRFYISFGTVGADSVAAHQVMCYQHPGRAFRNCRNCQGIATPCIDCFIRSYHTFWGSAYAYIMVYKIKSDLVRYGHEIDEYKACLKIKQRTNDPAYSDYTLEGLQAKQKQYGLLGYCVLNDIPEFDPVYDVINEGLHLLFLNNIPAPVEIWMNSKGDDISKYFKENVGQHRVAVLKKRLEYITFPRNISRKGTKFIDYPSKMVGEDWKNFMLCAALPLFRGLLHDDILNHYKILYNIIYLALLDYLSPTDYNKLEELLQEFHNKHIELYSTCQYKLTTHSLQHITMDIKNWGIIKANWTCILEMIPKKERKLNVYTNGKNVNHSFSKITAERIAQNQLYNTTKTPYINLRINKDLRQSCLWNEFICLDNRTVYISSKSRSLDLAGLYTIVYKDYSNSFILFDFIKSLYIVLQRYCSSYISSLSIDNYRYWYLFSSEYVELMNNNNNNSDIWNLWLSLLAKHRVTISNTICTKSVYLGYRKYYGVHNFDCNPLYGHHDSYSTQGEWVHTNIEDPVSSKPLYGRIHRFIYMNVNFNDIFDRDLELVQFYDWATENGSDYLTDYSIAENLPMDSLKEGYFFSICCIENKVCLQPMWENNHDTFPVKTKHLVVPYYSWYT